MSIGRRVEKRQILKVKLQANKDLKADRWELVINEAREESIRVFTDGSISEKGRVGGRWYIEKLAESKMRMGRLAIVWDSKIVEMRGGIQMVPEDHKILLLSDSQVAIAAIRKAGRTGRARTRKLKEVVKEIWKRQKNLGPDAVRFAWVKAHVGIQGNEKADQMAKAGAELGDENEGMQKVITEGGLRQEWKKRRAEERKVKGTGMGRVVKWNCKARVNYVHCRTGKGNLQAWRHVLDIDQSDECRKYGRYAETGRHVALVCIYAEEIGRKWGTWEDVNGGLFRQRVPRPAGYYELSK